MKVRGPANRAMAVTIAHDGPSKKCCRVILTDPSGYEIVLLKLINGTMAGAWTRDPKSYVKQNIKSSSAT